ncbi:MAG TPA: nucleoside recognition domain-containing protein, partial [Chitinophagaceae bacterium]|nr:nucleoside recognition domain-containing protein [Chitinophagaceae bacterium]
MALSRIWASFVIIAFIVAGFKFFSGKEKNIFSAMVTGKTGDSVELRTVKTDLIRADIVQALDSTSTYIDKDVKRAYRKADNGVTIVKAQTANGVIETCKDAVNICIGLIGIMTLFMGFMTIAEKAGGIRLLSRIIGPFFSRLFPGVPRDHPAHGHMMMNFSANMLGLDNAATPFGIKAMESLQELNPDKEKASNAQIMFLCLHAAGLCLIPVSIIALRATAHAKNATDIFIPCMIVTFIATMAAMIIVSIRQRINLFQPVILAWILGVSAIIAGFVAYLGSMNKTNLEFFSGAFGNGLLLTILFLIVLGGIYKKIDIFSAFIEGAKGGFETAVRIIPYLVGMLVAISMLRTSGTFDFIIDAIKDLFASIGADTRFVDGLPTALVRPFSG